MGQGRSVHHYLDISLMKGIFSPHKDAHLVWCWDQNACLWLPRRNPVEKALFYSKGKGGCHLVSPQKLKKICPALIQVALNSFRSDILKTRKSIFYQEFVYNVQKAKHQSYPHSRTKACMSSVVLRMRRLWKRQSALWRTGSRREDGWKMLSLSPKCQRSQTN